MHLERYYARKEPDNWHAVKVCPYGYRELIGSCMPITTHERFSPQLITTPNG